MSSPKITPITTFIVGVSFIVGAWLINTHFSIPMVEEAKTSESWPAAPGIITHSDVDQSMDDGKAMYAAEINYEFAVENKSYIGNKISLSSGNSKTSSLREVKKDLQEYPIGKEVTVYYDPELPNNAVLKTGADTFTYIIKYIPYVFGFFGILMVLQLMKTIGLLVLALFIGVKK